MARRWLKRILLATVGLLAVAALVIGLLVWKLFAFADEPQFASESDWFAHGSLGNAAVGGIPYPLFVVLPRVFPDLLPRPGGWRALGLPWEEGRPLPTGFSLTYGNASCGDRPLGDRLPYPCSRSMVYARVAPNCALCHTASWRPSADAAPTYVVGGPANTVDIAAVVSFLVRAGADPRFTAERLLPEIVLDFDLSWIDAQIYAFVVVPGARLVLRIAGDRFAWIDDGRPAWGPGRDDPFALPRYAALGLTPDVTSAPTDFPALWEMAGREGKGTLHWSAEAPDTATVIATSAFGALAVPILPGTRFEGRVARLGAFLADLKPPAWPFQIDATLAARGAEVFDATCASCHARGGSAVNTVVPLAEIATDPERARSWSGVDATAFERFTGWFGVKPNHLEGASPGYVAKPLPGLWLTAPYLHNGSVPSLDALLAAPADRPAVFWRGSDVYDPKSVGFIATGPGAERRAFRYDTALRGNAKTGHAYGTDLPADDKRALLEHLKTL